MSTKILVLEDDKQIRDTISEILQIHNFDVLAVENGKVGIEKLKSFTPDIILCDIMMPVMSGIEFLNYLKSTDIFSKIPFLFLTAKVSRDDLRVGMELGADDYITKPFKTEELLKAIESRLKRIQSIQKSVANNFDDFKKKIKVVGSHEFNTQLYTILASSDLILKNQEYLLENENIEFVNLIKNSAQKLHRNFNNLILFLSDSKKLTNLKWIGINEILDLIKTKINDTQSENLKRCVFEFENAEFLISKNHFIFSMFELIDNALRFSQEKVVIKGSQIGESFYIISIEDFGIGMDRSDIENINALTQFNRESLEQQGLGLGLYLSKKKLTSMGFNFSILSQKNKGTIVKIGISNYKLIQADL